VSPVEVFGLLAIAIMIASYAAEHRHSIMIAIFAVGCALAAIYAFLIGSYPFMIAEGVWAVIAIFRWRRKRSEIGVCP
jgi:hypothetical protein